MKNIYQYSVDNGLMDLPPETVETMDLPFNPHYIPLHHLAIEDFLTDEDQK